MPLVILAAAVFGAWLMPELVVGDFSHRPVVEWKRWNLAMRFWLEGHYLVMAALGFNIIVSILLGQLGELTGGPSGFPGIPRLRLGSFVVDTDREFYFVVWGLFLVLFALSMNH